MGMDFFFFFEIARKQNKVGVFAQKNFFSEKKMKFFCFCEIVFAKSYHFCQEIFRNKKPKIFL